MIVEKVKVNLLLLYFLMDLLIHSFYRIYEKIVLYVFMFIYILYFYKFLDICIFI